MGIAKGSERLRAPIFNIGDGVLFFGDQATVEQVELCKNREASYYIRFLRSGHTWASEGDLEPIELTYDND